MTNDATSLPVAPKESRIRSRVSAVTPCRPSPRKRRCLPATSQSAQRSRRPPRQSGAVSGRDRCHGRPVVQHSAPGRSGRVLPQVDECPWGERPRTDFDGRATSVPRYTADPAARRPPAAARSRTARPLLRQQSARGRGGCEPPGPRRVDWTVTYRPTASASGPKRRLAAGSRGSSRVLSHPGRRP